MKATARITSLLVFILTGFHHLNSQLISDTLILDSQSAVDSFQIHFPDLSVFEGSLKIQGNGIDNLNGLQNLTEVFGSLSIHSTALKKLESLASLKTVHGDFKVYSNPKLTSVNQLYSLDSVGGSFILSNNDLLTVINGFENLRVVNGNFEILYHDYLREIDITGTLASISGDLLIDANHALEEINGLGNLLTINGGLFLNELSSLVSFQGFDHLKHIGLYLRISNCRQLENIVGLNKLTHIGKGLEIINCEELKEIQQELPISDMDYLRITECKNLATIRGFRNLTTLGTLEILNTDLMTLNGLEALERVEQDLRLMNNPRLVALSQLSSLLDVGGNISLISNEVLGSLIGLHQLERIHGSLDIDRCTNLLSLRGLSALEHVEGDFELFASSTIRDLAGIENLKTVGGNLKIAANTNLRSLNGLNNLESVGGEFHLQGSTQVINLLDLESLKSVGGLSIYALGMKTLEGLESLDEIGNIILFSNQELESVDALRNCFSHVQQLKVRLNKNLTNLDGLDNIHIDNHLTIRDNENLDFCSVSSVCDFLDSFDEIENSYVEIENNNFNCDYKAIVRFNCDSMSSTEDENELASIEIHPNPSTGYIYVANQEFDSFQLINANGRILVEQNYFSRHLDFSRVPSGFYTLIFSKGGRKDLIKLVLM